MALIAKSGTPSLSTQTPPHNAQVAPGTIAGEAIAAGDVCYIAADGLVYRSIGTAANIAAQADGMAAMEADAGEAVTLFRGVTFRYGEGLTPGTPLYVGGTAGRLDTAATTGGTAPVAKIVDATRVWFFGSTYGF